jgi:hypothetical protein
VKGEWADMGTQGQNRHPCVEKTSKNEMVFLFQDKNMKLKYLSQINSAERVAPRILKITESIGTAFIREDLLYYKKDETLIKDLVLLRCKLNKFVKTVHDLEKGRQAGFIQAEGENCEVEDPEFDED